MPSAFRPLQLRSSSVHCVFFGGRAWRRVSKAEVNMEVDAKMVEENLEKREEDEEEEKEKEEEEKKDKEKNNSDKI